jgi:hypothetical protein
MSLKAYFVLICIYSFLTETGSSEPKVKKWILILYLVNLKVLEKSHLFFYEISSSTSFKHRVGVLWVLSVIGFFMKIYFTALHIKGENPDLEPDSGPDPAP